MERRKIKDEDIIGCRFGKLVALSRAEDKIDERTGRRRIMYQCACDCGRTLSVSKYDLIRNDGKGTKSCGCSRGVDAIGLYYTKIHSIWNAMIQRCYNSKQATYHRYGGRGIGVCDSWRYSFESFYKWAISSGYNETKNVSIDRINNDLGYSPENCRWSSKKQQANNRSSNRVIVYKGETHNLMEWSQIFGVNYKTLHNKLRTHGYAFEDIFNEITSH